MESLLARLQFPRAAFGGLPLGVQGTRGLPKALVGRAAAFDPVDLLACLGALHLMPENADRYVPLEALTTAVAEGAVLGSTAPVCHDDLVSLCTDPALTDGPIADAEDPFDNPFAEAFTFFGGSYTVFPGIAEEPTFILRELCHALFKHPEAVPDREFLRQARELVQSGLAVSDAVAGRSSIQRGATPVSRPRAPIAIPSPIDLGRLKGAVTFDDTELEEILRDQGLGLKSLQPLTLSLDEVSKGGRLKGLRDFSATPLVKRGGKVVVAMPSMIAPALTHAVVALAIKRGLRKHLVTRYADAVWGSVRRSLSFLPNEEIPIELKERLPWSNLRDGFFSLDIDKLAYVLVVTDPLVGYDTNRVFSEWDTRRLGRVIEDRLRATRRETGRLRPSPPEVLFLLVMQRIGRQAALRLRAQPTDGVLFLPLSAGDLETIALLEGGNQLSLYQYASARAEYRARVKVITYGALDEFHHYRSLGHTYYASDKEVPNVALIAPRGAGELRREVLRKRDWHAVPSHRTGRVVEVTSLFDTSEVPIYAALDNLTDEPALFVERMPCPVWVVGDHYPRSPELRRTSALFVECIAYWLWQFTPAIGNWLDHLDPDAPLLVRVHLDGDEEWLSALEGDEDADPGGERSQGGHDAVRVAADVDARAVRVWLKASVKQALSTEDNAAERELMRAVLAGLRLLHPTGAARGADDAQISDILETYAPLGRKKQLLLLSASASPDLHRRDAPPFRPIQEFDENRVLDDLASRIRAAEGLATGPIPDDRRVSVLNAAVKCLYEEMQRLIAELTPLNLLERLIAYHEATTHESAFNRLTIPTRIACFTSEPEMVSELAQRLPRLHSAALANRFVIEYATACPPSGTAPLSLSRYDRLQALASKIILLGFDSDVIHYGISDIRLALLPSGRLGFRREHYDRAMAEWLPGMAASHVDYATESFGRHWATPQAAGKKSTRLASRLDQAASVEFGHTLTDLATFIRSAIDLGQEQRHAVASASRSEFVRQLSHDLGWPSAKVADALELFSLRARSSFLNPGNGFRPVDVFPWRFNRALSYVRRPFLIRERAGDDEILWGTGHLFNAALYFVSLCLEGRLLARTAPMLSLMGQLNHEHGEAFNDHVARVIGSWPEMAVRPRVRKVGDLRGPAGPPGDIDVLAVDVKSHRVWILECKDFALARTPVEVASELASLSQSSPGSPSAIQRHLARAKWAKDHLAEILDLFGLSASADWEVKDALIVSEDMASPYLRDLGVLVRSIRAVTRERKIEP